MFIKRFNKTCILISVVILFWLLAGLHTSSFAGNPHSAYYSPEHDKIFWFIHVADLHIGTRGTNDSNNLTWLVSTAKAVIEPEFIVAAGDLTDSTNGNFLGIPNGPYQTEWNEYKQILSTYGINKDNYYDIPGNHDAYNDRYFDYYRANSIQGSYTHPIQISWIRQFGLETYHFLGVNTADNTGAAFSLKWPYGDYAGLDTGELSFIEQELKDHGDATLTLIFGHHPIRHKGASTDTYLYYGADQFINLMDTYGVSLYGYGHLHVFSEEFFTDSGKMSEGVYYLDVASLGKSSQDQYNIIAIDCDGISIINKDIRSWPAVMITTPLNVNLGVVNNPYTYDVPNSSANTIRALVFDQNQVNSVQYRINGGAWYPMQQVSAVPPRHPHLWEASWNASALPEGPCTIEVMASSASGTSADMISTNIYLVSGTNHPPIATDDAYTTIENTTLSISAPGVLQNDSDLDNNPLQAVLSSGPGQGTLTFNTDGGFTYTPKSNFVGTDSYAYKAYDGIVYSNTATVTINVNAVKDVVTILTASYLTKSKTLYVEATSSAQPNAVLTAVGYGQMTYNVKQQKYIFQRKVTPAPSSVTVTSNLGGSGTSTVVRK
jgi:hypothetical protein